MGGKMHPTVKRYQVLVREQSKELEEAKQAVEHVRKRADELVQQVVALREMCDQFDVKCKLLRKRQRDLEIMLTTTEIDVNPRFETW